MKRHFKLVAALMLFFSLMIAPFNPSGITTTQAASPYTEYYVVYTDNYDDGSGANLFITSPNGAFGTVEIPGLNWNQNFSVFPNQITEVLLPLSAEVQGSDIIANQGIRVRANNTIQVYLLNPGQPVQTNDAYTALPVEALGNEYFVMAWPDTLPARVSYGGSSEVAVLAPFNNTILTITPSVTTGIRTANVSYTITLNEFDVYTLQDDGLDEDLTGTSIHSSKPVAVFSGNRCVDIPRGYGWCDHIVEQMLPINTWGNSYITYPMASKTQGDFLRILSAKDGTSVSVNGPATVWQMPIVNSASAITSTEVGKANTEFKSSAVEDPTKGPSNNDSLGKSSVAPYAFPDAIPLASISQQINRGQTLTLLATGPVEITSSDPVLVAQFGTGQGFDTQGDPLMMLIPPAQQFLSHYTFLVPTGWFSNYVNIIIPTDSLSTIKLDGNTVSSGQFTEIGTHGYSAASISLAEGSHTIDASKPFAIYVYGFGDFVSYGYPGGLGTSTINPPVGTNNIPVIVIPGLGGTKLENDQGELWVGLEKLCADTSNHLPFPPDSLHMDVLRLDNSGTTPLFPNDSHYSSVKAGGILESVEGSCTIKKLGVSKTYDVSVPIYKNLIDNLERAGYQRGKDLFVFGYDWRRNITETAAQLDSLIDQVRNNGQVNIIAHSMGGLVTRNYIIDNTHATKVKNLAILGTPFLGTPDVLEALLFGDDLGINERVQKMTGFPFVKLVNEGEVKTIAQNWPGAYELLPSQRYLLVNSNGLIQEENVDKNGDNTKNGTLGYSQTLQYYKLNFNNGLIDVAESFRTDNLEGFDTIGTNNVNVIIFAGAGQQTKEGIKYFNRTTWGGLRTEEHAQWYSGNGDGTVPLHSVDLQGNGKNYQGNAKVYYAQEAHFGLIGNSDVFNQIMQVFGTGDLGAINTNISTNPLEWTVNGTEIKVFSPVNLHIYDAFGNHLGLSEDGGIEYGIPKAQYDIIGHDKMAFVPTGISYYVVLDGTDTGTFDLVIENISDGSTTNQVLFKSIPVTASTTARISLSPENGYLLSVDQNDDGTIDAITAPDSILDGSATEDTISPTSNITLSDPNQNGESIVDITAADNPGGSGILEVQYSIDQGNTFSIYSGPFTVDAGKVKRVISKAVDKAGNEEFPLSIAQVSNTNNGVDTTGVFRPSNGLLYLKNTNDTGIADYALNYGLPGDYPVVGDWDGNGTVTIGIYRNGYFYLRNENTIGFAEVVFPFGQPGDQPIAGDWDGDGVDTIGVFRPSIAQFLLRNSNTEGPAEMSFYLGNPGDVGIAGDWNGDGMDTTGVFRPGNGIIFLKNTNTTGIADIALNYGLPGDKPVTGDWNGDGIDTIGVYRNGTFFLRNENTIGFATIVFGLGNPGDMPIAGNWDGSIP